MSGNPLGRVRETHAQQVMAIRAHPLYRNLADGLSDMVEGGRLTEGLIPDDYQWLTNLLAQIAGSDPGRETAIEAIRERYAKDKDEER